MVYHKEPHKATNFVHHDQWKRLKSMNLNALIMHARQSSQGVGDAVHNKNNHPFTNANKSVGLVHNGRIFEYSTLKKRYEVNSDCDSEILLRIFETARARKELPEGEDYKGPEELLYGVNGVREIFSYGNDSHMAVAIAERVEDRRDLWLFHNAKRPLFVIDARDMLGQILFCSTAEIWESALRECPQALGLLGGRKHSILPMPTEEIWYFSISDELPVVQGQGQGYYRFILDPENEFTPWDDDGPVFPILKAENKIPLICDLGDNDELTGVIQLPIVSRHKKNKFKQHHNKTQWEDQSDRLSGPGVSWNKDGSARYEDQDDDYRSQYDDDNYMSGYHDDVPPSDYDKWEDRLEDEVDRYHGLTPLELENGNLIASDRHVSGIGKVISKRMRERSLAVGYNDNSENHYDSFDVAGLEKVIKDIVQTAHDIETSALNMAKEGSLTPQTFQDNMESLQSILIDLKGNQCMLEKY